MENYTDIPPSPFLKEELLRELGLAPHARERLVEARERGTISPQEIAALLGNALLKDRVKMAKTIQELAKLFAGINIKIEISHTHTHTHTHRHTHTVTPRMPRHARQIEKKAEQTEMPAVPPDSEPDARELEALEHEKETALEELVPSLLLDGDGTEPNSYYRAVAKHRFLSYEEIMESGRKWREQGDANAWTNLVLHNLRLVMRVAKKYIGRGLDFDDLVQEGNIGLMIAADKFDYRKGFRFTTYACWWIRATITRAVANFHGTVRQPMHIVEYRQKILKVMAELGAELEREPTVEEIAARSGEADIEKVKSALTHWNFTYTSLDELVNYHRSDSGDEETEQGDTMADEVAMMPTVSLEVQEKLEEESRAVLLLLATLRALPVSDRQKEVFRAYYGLDGGSTDDLTLEDVGARFGVTRERIRQLNVKTWAALREAGIEMDDTALMERIRRVDELEKLAAVTAVLPPQEEETSLQENNAFLTVPEKEREIIEKVLAAVGAVCGVEKAELTKRKCGQYREYLEAQRIAVYLLVEEYKLPQKIITWTFRRTRTFIADAMAKVSEKLETDPAFAEQLSEIKKLAQEEGEIRATSVAPAVDVARILSIVAETYGTTPERLTAKGVKKSERDIVMWARKVALYLLHTDARLNRAQLADMFNRKGYQTELNVGRTVKEIKMLLAVDAEVKEEIENIRARYR